MIRTGEVTMRVFVGFFGMVAFLFAARGAVAQQKPTKGVITLAEVTIVGRIQKPIAAVDVNRIQPKLTLQEFRQPFVDLVEKAVYQDPF
jgi:hypothetical protein